MIKKLYKYYEHISLKILQLLLLIYNKIPLTKEINIKNNNNEFLKELEQKLKAIDKTDKSYVWLSKIVTQSIIIGLLTFFIFLPIVNLISQQLLDIRLGLFPAFTDTLLELFIDYLVLFGVTILSIMIYILLRINIYLNYQLREKRRKIEKSYIEGIWYSQSIIRVNDNIDDFIKSVSDNKEILGEFGEIIYKINKKSNHIGMDQAMQEVKNTVPSPKLESFISNLQNSYNNNKSPKPVIDAEFDKVLNTLENQYSNKKKKVQILFVGTILSMASLMLFALVAIFLSMMGGGGDNILPLTIMFFLPLIVVTLILVDKLSGKKEYINKNKKPFDIEDQIKIEYKKEYNNFKNKKEYDTTFLDKTFIDTKIQYKIKQYINYLIRKGQIFRDKPIYTFTLTIPATIIYYIFLDFEISLEIFLEESLQSWLSVILIPFILLTLLPSYYARQKIKRNNKIMNNLPTIIRGFKKDTQDISEIDYVTETIEEEYKKSRNHLYWFKDKERAWKQLSNNVKNKFFTMVISILIQTNKITNDNEKSIEITEEYINKKKNVNDRIKELKQSYLLPLMAFTFIIISVMYIAYEVWIVQVIIDLIPDSEEIDENIGFISTVNPEHIESNIRILYLAISMSIGLLQGQFNKNSLLAGVYPAILYSTIAIIIILLSIII